MIETQLNNSEEKPKSLFKSLFKKWNNEIINAKANDIKELYNQYLFNKKAIIRLKEKNIKKDTFGLILVILVISILSLGININIITYFFTCLITLTPITFFVFKCLLKENNEKIKSINNEITSFEKNILNNIYNEDFLNQFITEAEDFINEDTLNSFKLSVYENNITEKEISMIYGFLRH